MENDFKIELFAYDVFVNTFAAIEQVWPRLDPLYIDECWKIESYIEAIHISFYEAAYCRAVFFKSLYSKALTEEIIQSLKSLSDCYDYVVQICDRKDLFDHLTIFERMFGTLSFVISLCLVVNHTTKNNIDLFNNGHILWAMYFEKFTEKFYEEGGWMELKRVASSYFTLYLFIVFLMRPNNNLCLVKQAFVNYQQFKNSPQFYDCKYVSKQWIKFSKHNFDNYINIPIYYEYSVDCHEANVLLEGVKQLCNPYSKADYENFERFMGFKPNEIKSIPNSVIEHNVSEHKDISSDANFYEFSKDGTDFVNKSRSEGNFINSKVPFNVIENSINLNSLKENNERKATSKLSANPVPDHNHNPVPVNTTEMHLESEIENLPEKVNLDLDKSSENISVNTQKGEFPSEIFSSGCIHGQDDTLSKVNVSRTKEKDLIKKVDLMCLKIINEIANNTEKMTDIGKNINHVVRTTKTSPERQMAVYENNQNTTLKQISSPNHFKPKNKCENTTHESTKISNDDDNLRNKNELGLNDLHRMLLVLGDRQGIEYVLSTLPNSKSMQKKLNEKR